jgi:hypothetical protein
MALERKQTERRRRNVRPVPSTRTTRTIPHEPTGRPREQNVNTTAIAQAYAAHVEGRHTTVMTMEK